MEPSQLISEEWGSLSGLYTAEEADFMTQLLGGKYSVTEKYCGNSTFGMPSTFCPGLESTGIINTNSHFPSNVANTNFYCFSQGSSSSTDSGSNIFSTTSSGTCSFDPVKTFDSMSVDFCLGDAKFSPQFFQWNDNLSQQINVSTDEESGLEPGNPVLNDHNLQAKRECKMMVHEPAEEEKSSNQENPAKKLRRPIEVSENIRNGKSRKNLKSASISCNNEEDRSAGLQRQGSSSCFSEGDSNPSLELNGGTSSSLSPAASNLHRKLRSTSCPGTDPQTLYARKRRERINERLRILQNLVPNGTKVDISTMLEEAVQYVKFLQHQIKLLSSDDLWMYAPIAYNGINIGLDITSTPTNGL